MAPTVRDLNDLIATIGQSVNPMKQQIDADIAANQQYGEAQIAGLDAKKTRAFGDIEQAAQNKGMFFSGFSPDAQATYTADTYLPALASLQQTIAQTRSGLLKEKLSLDQGVFDKAFASQEQDRAVLADWNKMTAQQQFEASEAEKQRVFTAQQNEKDRASQAGIAAANRAASSARASADKPDVAGTIKGVGDFLAGKVGKDGKVSPATFQQGRQQWMAAGGDPSSYAQAFMGYVNQSHYQDYYGN